MGGGNGFMFKDLHRFVRFGLFAALALAPQLAQASDMTTKEIEQELIGRQIVWWQDGGWFHGQLFLGEGGLAEISVGGPAPTSDLGKWLIRGGEMCTAWGKLRERTQKCYTVQRAAPGRFTTSGGNVFEIREAGV
jgi:hypothetical protein